VTRRLPLLCALACCLLIAAPAQIVLAKDIKVQATVNKQEIAAVEPLLLVVSVEGDSGQVDLSPLEQEGAFRVAGRSSSTNISITAGSINRISEYSFHLFPLREGELRIPPLPVKVDDQILMTEAVPVRVRPIGAGGQSRGPGAGMPPGARPPFDPFAQGQPAPPPQAPSAPHEPGAGQAAKPTPPPSGDEVFLEAELSKPEVWVGESLLYILKIYVGAHISNGRIDMPDFSGFSAKELERKEHTSVVNGRQYEVTEAQFLLTALKPGEINFGPAALNCDLVRRSRWNPRSVFDQFFNDPFFKMDPLMPGAELEPRVFRGRPLTLKVNALPPFSGPGEFSGCIGTVNLQAELDKTSLEAGESATLSLTLEGQGNVQDAIEPKLALPASLKVYKDVPQSEVKAGPDGYEGKKIFKFALVPLEPGELRLPEATLVSFDPRGKRYVTSRAAIPALAVRAPAKQEQAVAATPAPVSPAATAPGSGRKVEFQHKDALPLKEGLAALQDQSPLSAGLFWLLAVAPPALFGLSLAARRFGRREKSLAAQLMERAEAAFNDAENLARADEPDRIAILTACGKGLLAAVCAVVGRQAETLTYAEAEELLAGKQAPEELRRRVVELMRRLDACRYGGAGLEKDALAGLLAEARDVARSLRP
jgi:hypothetical protein